MTARAGIWAAGAAGSLAVHGAMLLLLLYAIRPEPITDQPMPQTEIDVQAHQVPRQSAQERRPDAETAARGDATGTGLAAGAIPQNRAAPQRPEAQRVAGTRPAGDRTDPAASTATRLAASRARPTVAAPAVQTATALAQALPALARVETAGPPPAQPVAAAQVTPAVARPAAAQPDTLIPTGLPLSDAVAVTTPLPPLPEARPAPDPVSQAAPDMAALPSFRADPVAAPEARPPTQPTPTAAPSPERLKAALAFSGAGDGDVDPVSLAAFQSFMRPGDAVAEGDPLRDGVAGLLAQVPCSRLQVVFDPDTATLSVKGHVPEDGLRAPVLAALRDQMGADIAVSDDILILPRPQCGALSGIGDVGLPQSTDQITNPLLIGSDTHARVLDFVEGQRLWFDLTAPDYAAYVYVDYFDAGGNVLHLSPNEQVPLQSAPPQTALRIGTKTDDDTGLQIFIGPPYGQEIAVAFAASHPLYDGLRPLIEPAAPYLDWLKERVAEAREKHPDFKGEWVYFFVSTAER